MGLIEIVLIIFVIFFLFGGGYGYQRRSDWGRAPMSIFGILFIVVVLALLLRVI